MDVNRLVISGRLVRDPELTYLESGTPMAKITIAHNKYYYEDGEYKSRPVYLDVTLFGKTAENVIANCNQGDIVIVDGELDITYYKQGKITRKNITIEKIAKISWQKKKGLNKNSDKGVAKLKRS